MYCPSQAGSADVRPEAVRPAVWQLAAVKNVKNRCFLAFFCGFLRARCGQVLWLRGLVHTSLETYGHDHSKIIFSCYIPWSARICQLFKVIWVKIGQKPDVFDRFSAARHGRSVGPTDQPIISLEPAWPVDLFGSKTFGPCICNYLQLWPFKVTWVKIMSFYG